ncbi:extracellular metalloprotease [Pseudovirgaria hyperparasitica]|uniref:Extracellular metalloprotease n=1 Tax=Pseudovirgaria hyperparasitica TaxID=470096 RepID=A0A6A6VTF1_9PEZI|nr:extracellular metalloprotease [Pseudovirgaria hyperparasitica]KAF2753159.1 extracellular metalloprotease [Pseudovirgaria hyperparasitica]
MCAVLIVLAGLIALITAHPAEHTLLPRKSDFGCGSEPTKEFIATAQAMAAQEENGELFMTTATLEIATYFHLVTAKANEVSDTQLQQQIVVMNENYAPYGISFNVIGIDKTINSRWAYDQAELEMKGALRKGNYKTLNVYFQTSLGGNLGYCYFPTSGATPGSTILIRDGCAILAQSVPGGSSTNFNLGKTVTHEVGHWFGLFHTFQGGCDGGDSVADTPAQASPSSGCPIGRDSCSATGLDPVHNYMDYSDDSCYEEFTEGQKTRMYNMFHKYRAQAGDESSIVVI